MQGKHIEVAEKEVRLAVAAIHRAQTKRELWGVLAVGAGSAMLALWLLHLVDKGVTIDAAVWHSPLLPLCAANVAISCLALIVIRHRAWVVHTSTNDFKEW